MSIAARDEARARAEREAARADRPVDRAERRRRRARAGAAGRRVLALGQAVDLVVEQQHLAIEIAAQQVHHVVAADRQPVAVAGDDPDVELGIGELDARRDRRRAAVDGVEAVGLDVVGEAARAADAGDEHGVLRARADLGQGPLHRLEDRSSRRSRGTSALPGRCRNPWRVSVRQLRERAFMASSSGEGLRDRGFDLRRS